ncbi:MAG: hypothetical protein ABSF99_01075 [Anaerolineales bacterium]|jgi:hypothetical protein
MIAAQDNFKIYFAEKLWEMIPAVYRNEDGLGDQPGPLRALVEILAEQAAILRRSQDRLWEDQFIELCDAWAVPYIADLVATRLVSALNLRSRRLDVAKTIYYRRRKGTPGVLEELISDIADWEGKLVEMFTRLGRTRHALDPKPGDLAGRFSGTLPGGWADLRDTRAAERAGGPFEEYFHTPDFRRARGADGRYNLPKLAFHLYRLGWFPVTGVTPFAVGNDGRYTFDPSGRDIPLFSPRLRSSDWSQWQSAMEWELPAPISCRLLGHAEYCLTEAIVRNLEALAAFPAQDAKTLRRLIGVRFPSEARLKEVLSRLCLLPTWPAGAFREILVDGLVASCGKAALSASALSVEDGPGSVVAPADLTAGDLAGWPLANPGKRLVIDPERGRFQVFGPTPATGSQVSYCYGFSGKIGAGSYPRLQTRNRPPTSLPNITAANSAGTIPANRLSNQGVTQINDSTTYLGIGNKIAIQNLTLQAADRQRPYIRLKTDWKLTSANADASLVLDGLWLGAEGNYSIILRGGYEQVSITNCTLDPGGVNDATGHPINAVTLFIEAKVRLLTIDSSILGRVFTRSGGEIERLVISDSILDALDDGKVALELDEGTLELTRATVMGQLNVERLWASEALITSHVEVTDTQDGCFRFSAAPAGSRLPRPFQSFELTGTRALFTERHFGQPGYAQLSQAAPSELLCGAEDGSEMGAFSSLHNPIKLDGLKTKIEEYMPFGLVPVFYPET